MENINFASMKVVIDDKIPFIRQAAEQTFDEVVYLPGREMSARDVASADALIVRTRTRCDAALLEGSSVKFVATATIGFDHLDTAWLDRHGIGWTNCPGCNASSVAQYVRNSLFALHRDGLLNPQTSVVGIVGCGHVGSAVEAALRPVGCRILRNDPPRALKEGRAGFVDLQTIATACDVITFHTPLTQGGLFPTCRLANAAWFRSLRRQPVIINAARGGVVDENALMAALSEGRVSHAVIDTWENEPDISRSLLQQAYIGTPHVAGYSADGKANAARMSLDAVCRYFGLPSHYTILPPPLPRNMKAAGNNEAQALQLYDPCTDSRALKARPETFEYLRNHYHLRRERWDYGDAS